MSAPWPLASLHMSQGCAGDGRPGVGVAAGGRAAMRRPVPLPSGLGVACGSAPGVDGPRRAARSIPSAGTTRTWPRQPCGPWRGDGRGMGALGHEGNSAS